MIRSMILLSLLALHSDIFLWQEFSNSKFKTSPSENKGTSCSITDLDKSFVCLLLLLQIARLLENERLHWYDEQ